MIYYNNISTNKSQNAGILVNISFQESLAVNYIDYNYATIIIPILGVEEAILHWSGKISGNF